MEIVLPDRKTFEYIRDAMGRDGWEITPYAEPLRARVGFIATKEIDAVEEMSLFCYEPMGAIDLEIVDLGRDSTEQEIEAAFTPFRGAPLHPCDDPKSLLVGFVNYDLRRAVRLPLSLFKRHPQAGGIKDLYAARVPWP